MDGWIHNVSLYFIMETQGRQRDGGHTLPSFDLVSQFITTFRTQWALVSNSRKQLFMIHIEHLSRFFGGPGRPRCDMFWS